jgi:hypothetical protein
MKKDIFELELHEKLILKDEHDPVNSEKIVIIRVHNGWIYIFYEFCNIKSTVFVPKI